MKILTPINSLQEVEMLAENGAEEFYCGLVPEEWLHHYGGALWLNRRSPKGGNVQTFAELNALIAAAHQYGIPVFLTLNAPAYAPEQMSMVIDLARRLVEEAGADALIIADPGLLVALVQSGLDAPLHLSSLAATLNGRAIDFFRQWGVRRIILPRSVTLDEMRHLAEAARGVVELEAFILNEGCAFEEGYCPTSKHHSVGAYCTGLADMEASFFTARGDEVPSAERREVNALLQDYYRWLFFVNNAGCSLSPEGLPYGPCGLCAIPQMHRMGIASLKIVGREASSWRKLASLRLVKAVVDRVRQGRPDDEVRTYAQSLRTPREYCQSGFMCYYRWW